MQKAGAALRRSVSSLCAAVPFLRDARACLLALWYPEPGAGWEPICSRAEPPRCPRTAQHLFTRYAEVLPNQACEQLTLWPAAVLTSVPLILACTVKAGPQSSTPELNPLMLVFNCQKDTVEKPTRKPVTGEEKTLLCK